MNLSITYTYNKNIPRALTYNKHLNVLIVNMVFKELITPGLIHDTATRIMKNNVPESVIEAIYDHCKEINWSKDVTVVFTST